MSRQQLSENRLGIHHRLNAPRRNARAVNAGPHQILRRERVSQRRCESLRHFRESGRRTPVKAAGIVCRRVVHQPDGTVGTDAICQPEPVGQIR